MSPPSGWLASSAVYWHVTGIGRLERDRWRHLLCEDLSRLNLCAPLCQYGQIIDGGLNKRRIPAPFPQLLPETWNFSFLRTRREKKLSLLAFISYARNQQSWRLNSSLCTHLRDSYLLNSNSLWELRDKRIRSRVVKKTNNYCIERCIKTFITSLDFFLCKVRKCVYRIKVPNGFYVDPYSPIIIIIETDPSPFYNSITKKETDNGTHHSNYKSRKREQDFFFLSFQLDRSFSFCCPLP